MKNRDNISKNGYSGVFGVADYASVIRFKKFKMPYSIAAAEMKTMKNVKMK